MNLGAPGVDKEFLSFYLERGLGSGAPRSRSATASAVPPGSPRRATAGTTSRTAGTARSIAITGQDDVQRGGRDGAVRRHHDRVDQVDRQSDEAGWRRVGRQPQARRRSQRRQRRVRLPLIRTRRAGARAEQRELVVPCRGADPTGPRPAAGLRPAPARASRSRSSTEHGARGRPMRSRRRPSARSRRRPSSPPARAIPRRSRACSREQGEQVVTGVPYTPSTGAGSAAGGGAAPGGAKGGLSVPVLLIGVDGGGAGRHAVRPLAVHRRVAARADGVRPARAALVVPSARPCVRGSSPWPRPGCGRSLPGAEVRRLVRDDRGDSVAVFHGARHAHQLIQVGGLGVGGERIRGALRDDDDQT